MIKKNIKKYALFCLTAILVCTMGVLINMPLNNVKGGTVSFEIANVEDTNRIGTEIALSEEVAIEYNGNTVNFSKGSITFPDGKTYNVGTYKMSQVGKYTVRYYYQDGNVIVTAEKSFEVTDSYFALTSASGSITPVTAEEQKAVHEKETVINGTELALKSNADNVTLNGKDALILRLQDGCQFIYNTPIDLSKAGEDGIAEILSVNYRLGNLVPNDDPKYWEPFMFKSKTIPTAEEFNFSLLNDAYLYRYSDNTAGRCKIKLTDAYNPDIYVELDDQKAYLGDRGSAIFHQNYKIAVSAAANGQILVGCRKGSTASKYGGVAEINGEQYIAYQNWNRATSNSAYLTSGKAHQEKGTQWGFDCKNNIVYTRDVSNNWTVVNDLDHPSIYPDNPFPGFTTGEVYVSIYFTDYAGAGDARIDIYDIGGVSGAELCAQNNKSGRVDFTAPEIFIDYDETDKGVIYAPLNGEVELPKAFVKEVFSDGSYNVNVYTNYNTEYKKLVTTKNNKLKLVENTVYTIEYTAVDSSGQVGKATMNICPVDTEKSIWVETTKITEAHAGDLIKLPEYVIKTINNANKVKYSIKVVGENETIEVDTALNVFRPQYMGKYKVIFEFEDNAYDGVYEYEIDVTGDTAAKFLTKPILPKYVVSGETYSFDMLKGYIFSTTSVQEVGSEGYISVDGGDFVKIPDINAYKITATDNIRVKFKNGDSESEVSEAKVITNSVKVKNAKGVEVDVVRLYKYFVGDYTANDPFNEAGRPTAASVTYSMNQTTDDQTLTFANLVDVDKFIFQFKPGTETNYSALDIVLTDVYDEDIKLVIKYFTKGAGYVISVNGVESFVSGAFASAEATYSIEYNKAKKQMIVNGLIFNYGFENFNSNLAYFDIVMEKVNGPASITVEKVGNHVFRGTKQKDDVQPQINVVTSDGTYEIGSTVTLNVPTFTDVISQINKSKNAITIEHEDGTKFTVEDIYKPYDLKLDKLGVWSVIYNTEDTVGNKAQYRYALTVADRSAPEIVVDNYTDDTMIVVKKGTLYNLKYTVTDNMTATENLIVSVRMENLKTGEMIDPASTTELKCTIEGDYAVFISAVDEFKNYSYKVVYIRVEGGKK